jgi:hypothetical protein
VTPVEEWERVLQHRLGVEPLYLLTHEIAGSGQVCP